MKRKELIQQKLDDKQKVDFEEIHEDDVRSMKRMISEEEDKLHDVKKQIKRYKENHTLCIGADFVSLIELKDSIEGRIRLLNKIKEDHV
jgi:hypothetical protein